MINSTSESLFERVPSMSHLNTAASERLSRETAGSTVVYACTPRFWAVWRGICYIMAPCYFAAVMDAIAFVMLVATGSDLTSNMVFLVASSVMFVWCAFTTPWLLVCMWQRQRTFFALTPDEILLNLVRNRSLDWMRGKLLCWLMLVHALQRYFPCSSETRRLRYDHLVSVDMNKKGVLLLRCRNGETVKCKGIHDPEFAANYIRQQMAPRHGATPVLSQ